MQDLIAAAYDVERLESLLEGEANVNTDGYRLLSYAIEHGITYSVKTLLRHGFDLNLRRSHIEEHFRKSGESPYIPSGTPMRHSFYFSTLGGGVRKSWRNEMYSKSIQILLDNGANVDELDETQTTVLNYVAACGCIEIMKVLIDEGADKGAGVIDTPLDSFLMAHQRGDFLSEYGSDDDLDDDEITKSVASLLAPNEEALQRSLEKYLHSKDEDDEQILSLQVESYQVSRMGGK